MIKVKKKSDLMWIASFLLPGFILYFTFQIIPLIAAFYFSLSNWDGMAGSPINFVGLKNYINLLSDKFFLISMMNMLKIVFFSVLFHTPIALLLAIGIHKKIKGYRIYKTIFFIPNVFPLTAVGLMWYFVFTPNGVLNNVLKTIHLDSLVHSWLIDPKTAMSSIILVNIWAGIGFFMVILLAGLTTIPDSLYEAADIDGASSFDKFRYITIPMLKPIISLCIVMDIIGTIKVFDLVFSMTEGGPNGLTNVPASLLYYESFRYGHYGKGSAIGIILLMLTLIMTYLGNKLLLKKKEVNNEEKH